MKISVITVCYNPGNGLKKTIDSVINNSNDNIEYIIIDGGSTDGTIELLNTIHQKNLQWISEPDNGIYDAMNKGISKATGDWIIFMNAGDTFYDSQVINNIKSDLDIKNTIIYGDMICNEEVIPAKNINSLRYGIIMACHQSMFFNKKLLGEDLKYDLTYTIYADYELVTKIVNKYKNPTKYIKKIISNYEGGGVSDKISKKKRIDKYRILFKYYGLSGVFKGLIYWVYNNIKKIY